MNSKIIFVSALIILAVSQIDPPVWPNQFQEAFEEEYITANGTFRDVGVLFYDATNNRSRYDRVDGQYDAFCNSLSPNQTTDCSNLVIAGKRWIIFPQKNQCCFCCDAAHGCGILKPNWLEGGEFLGQETIGNFPVYKWNKDGVVGYNYYYATTDARRIPVRINENGGHIINFIPLSYRQGAPDERVFQLPSYCNDSCPLASICGKLRMSEQKTQ